MAYTNQSMSPVHTCEPPVAVMWCFTHHLMTRRTYNGVVEKVVDPPPHKVEVKPRELNGRVHYASRCPMCGGVLVRKRGDVLLVRTSRFNAGQVRADARGY